MVWLDDMVVHISERTDVNRIHHNTEFDEMIWLTQYMPRVILCTWRGFLPKHFSPDHLQGNICP